MPRNVSRDEAIEFAKESGAIATKAKCATSATCSDKPHSGFGLAARLHTAAMLSATSSQSLSAAHNVCLKQDVAPRFEALEAAEPCQACL